jgi:hypothetical protein
MRSFEQLGLEDLTRFELGQFFKRDFRTSHFNRFRRLGETLETRAEHK